GTGPSAFPPHRPVPPAPPPVRPGGLRSGRLPRAGRTGPDRPAGPHRRGRGPGRPHLLPRAVGSTPPDPDRPRGSPLARPARVQSVTALRPTTAPATPATIVITPTSSA